MIYFVMSMFRYEKRRISIIYEIYEDFKDIGNMSCKILGKITTNNNVT